MEIDAYIALGSNVGDRELNLLQAVAALGRLPGCRVTALSRFYVTSPVGMSADTPPFYNAVVRLATTRKAPELLQSLQQIERKQFGRLPSVSYQSRRMDLDLLLYGDLSLTTPELTLPHPRMAQRRFVLAPLADIAAELREPVSGRTIAQLLAEVRSNEKVRLLEH